MKKLKFTFFAVLAALVFGVPALAQSRGNAGTATSPTAPAAVRFCLTYWAYEQELPTKIYYKESPNSKTYKVMKIGVMCFFKEFEYRGKFPMPIFRKATAAEIEQRKKESGVKANDLEYIKIADIHSDGHSHFGVVLLPSKTPFSKESQLIFSLDEKAFPYGSYRIYNVSSRPIGLKIKSESAADYSKFTMRPGQAILSPKLSKEHERFDFEAYALIKNSAGETQPKLIWKTIGFMKSDDRVCVFLAEDKRRSQETGKLKMTTRSVPVPNFSAAASAARAEENKERK